MVKEIWKNVVRYEGYYKVSNLGRVRSLDRIVRHKSNGTRVFPGKTLKLETTYQGYKRVSLAKNGKAKRFTVHHLVAEAFIGEYPEGKVINHINEIKGDNRPVNLEYVTQKENVNHGSGIEKRAKSQRIKVRATHLETGEVLEFKSMVAAERESNGFFHNGHISQACKGKLPHHRNYKWEKVTN